MLVVSGNLFGEVASVASNLVKHFAPPGCPQTEQSTFWHVARKSAVSLYSPRQSEKGKASLSNARPPACSRCLPPCFGCMSTLEARDTLKRYQRREAQAGGGTTETTPYNSRSANDYDRKCGKGRFQSVHMLKIGNGRCSYGVIR